MPVDNKLYDAMADSWWDEAGFLHVLKALNPARFGYMRRVLVEELRLEMHGRRTLDVGCGGGLLAEEFARLGCAVTGVDPSEASLAAARVHAQSAGLGIDYRQGTGEVLPFSDTSFDIVYCCDVLEHVDDLRRVIAEIGRVLTPGGVFLYDTINRTFQSWLVMIKLFQEWSWTSFMPPRLHDWNMFIRPAEMDAHLVANGLTPHGLRGLKPRAGLFRAIAALRTHKRGLITCYESTRRADLGESDDTSVLYMGYATKSPA